MRDGVETAVLVSIEEWKKLTQTARPTLKQLLLSAEPRFPLVIRERGKQRSRRIVEREGMEVPAVQA